MVPDQIFEFNIFNEHGIGEANMLHMMGKTASRQRSVLCMLQRKINGVKFTYPTERIRNKGQRSNHNTIHI
jgi:hypothetical protein